MQRNLGVLGESTFKNLCASVGLVANKSEQDEFGWDYIVEFPYENKNISIDMCQPIECKVQVKATYQQKRKLAVKVSALDRLVKTPNPAFIVFLEFDKENEFTSIFLRHIDEEIIEKTLKRSRELSSQNKPLHKSTIQIRYDKYRLKNTKGIILKEAIEFYLPNGVAKYVKDKQYLLETLGFEGSLGGMQLTFDNTSLEELMDISLGIIDKPLKIKSIQNHKEIRFGIELPAQDTFFQKLNIKNTKITISDIQGKDALIILVDEDDEVLMKTKAKIIPSPFWTEKYLKVKIDTDIFYFTMSSKKGVLDVGEFELKFDYFKAKPLLLSDILKYYKFYHLIVNHPKKVFHNLIRDDSIFSMTMEKESIEPEIVYTYEIANKLQKILDKMGRYEDISLHIDDLENNKSIINNVYNLLFETTEKINISFTPTEKQDLNQYKAIAYIPFVLTLNNNIYTAWILLDGLAITTDGYKYKINIKKVILKKESFNLFNLNPDFFHKRFNEFIKSDDSDNAGNIAMLNLELIPNIIEKKS